MPSPSIIVYPNAEGPVHAHFEVQPKGENRPETFDRMTAGVVDGASPVIFSLGENGLYTMTDTAHRTDGSNPEESTGFRVPKGYGAMLYLSGVRADALGVELVDIEGTVEERRKPFSRPVGIKVVGQDAESFSLFSSRTKVRTPKGFMSLNIYTREEPATLNVHAGSGIHFDNEGPVQGIDQAVA